MNNHSAKRKGKLQMPHQLMKGSFALTVSAALCLAAPHKPAASETETPAMIRAAVQSAIVPRLAAINGARIDSEVGAIDPRLQLPSCPAINVSLPPVNAAAMTAKVECEAPAWTIYVPVRLHAWVEAIVAAANLSPNTRLAADHLSRARVDMFGSSGGLVLDPAQAEGKILRVGLLAGAPILSPFLELPTVVRRGQKVLLTLTASTMVIKATAVAMEDGRVGDSIMVENPDSKKTLHATVAADGSVEITLNGAAP
jgi:flagella basal body P-ring formation protein FlgA